MCNDVSSGSGSNLPPCTCGEAAGHTDWMSLLGGDEPEPQHEKTEDGK